MAAGLYDITQEVLGKGHFAVVKLARHCLTSELVAVKIVDKTKLTAESLQQHSQEVKVLSRLSEHEHPNIVKLYQVINTKTKLYLVMEYCGRDVCDLYDYIQKKFGGSGLPEMEAKHIFRQICSAISYCHSLNIVHRDLKPENLLIVTQPTQDEDGLDNATTQVTSAVKYPIVKLIDFGFANYWTEGAKLKTSCGSLAYSAPEILLGDSYDGDKVDIWGLGCLLYILLYGCNPFMQMNDNETLIKILDCNFSTPSRPTISLSAIRLIRSLLVREPKDRQLMSRVMSDAWFDGLDSDPIFQSTTGPQVTSPPPTTTPPSNISSPTSTPSPSRMAHPSMMSSSTTYYPLRSKSPSTVNEVHDRVINEMITNKMCTSKERVERALRLARITSGSGRSSSIPSLPVVGEGEVLQNTTTNPCSSPGSRGTAKSNVYVTNNNNSGSRHGDEVSLGPTDVDGVSDSYITATYNLLKDKMVREIQGIPTTSTNVQEIVAKTSATHTKRSHVLPGRRRGGGVSQAPRFGRPGGLDDLSLKKQLMEEELKKSKSEVIVEEDGFVLPLQRKCSIVSEEGSCELSGRLSDAGSDNIHTLLMADGEMSLLPKRPSIPTVNIVVTDADHEDDLEEIRRREDEEDDRLMMIQDLSEEVDIAEEELSNGGPSSSGNRPLIRLASPEDDEDVKEITTDAKNLPTNPSSMTTSRGLHAVSSSPDLTQGLSKKAESDLFPSTQTPTNTQVADGRVSGSAGRRNSRQAMTQDDSQVDDVGEHVKQGRRSSKLADRTGGAATNLEPPSVRSITQSKSCNDILYKDGPEDDVGDVDDDCKKKKKASTDCCIMS